MGSCGQATISFLAWGKICLLCASVSPSTKREMQSLVLPSFSPAFTLILQMGKLRHRMAECSAKFHDPKWRPHV